MTRGLGEWREVGELSGKGAEEWDYEGKGGRGGDMWREEKGEKNGIRGVWEKQGYGGEGEKEGGRIRKEAVG